MSGASPQRLLSEDPGDLAGVTRQGNREGVLTLSETERSALLASTFEIAAKAPLNAAVSKLAMRDIKPARASARRQLSFTPHR